MNRTFSESIRCVSVFFEHDVVSFVYLHKGINEKTASTQFTRPYGSKSARLVFTLATLFKTVHLRTTKQHPYCIHMTDRIE